MYKLQVKTRSRACTHTPLRVLQHRTLPPSQCELWGCHVSSGSRTCLPAKVGSDVATCIMTPNSLGGLQSTTYSVALDPASLLGGLQAAMRPAVPCGPRASNIKKSLAGLPVRLDPCVPNVHAHISKTLDVRAIMGLQDVRAGSAVNACKICGQVATIQL
jgi:hypothetical protein